MSGKSMAKRPALAEALERVEAGAAGRRLGRPPTLWPELRRRIRKMRNSGKSYPAIATALNAEGVPTAHGGLRWYPATVRKVAAAA